VQYIQGQALQSPISPKLGKEESTQTITAPLGTSEKGKSETAKPASAEEAKPTASATPAQKQGVADRLLSKLHHH
jgi:hypothetical protein